MGLRGNPTWYDYKMVSCARLMNKEMTMRVDKEGIHIFTECMTRHIATYKKMKWEKFYNEILPKLLGE